MKRMILVVIGFVFLCSIGLAENLTFGYVDFEKVFNEYHKTKAEDARLKAELEKKKKEFDAKRDEINKLRDSMELLGEDARKEKENNLREKIGELSALRKDTEERLLEERNKKWLEIYNEIKEVVAEYGKKQKYTFVFDDKALIYKLDKYDITDKVVEILNKTRK